MVTRQNVVCEVTSTRLGLSVLHGGAVSQSRCERFNPPGQGVDWAETLRQRHATLSGWVKELGLSGCGATVLFTSPTSVSSLASVSAALGDEMRRRAAVMTLADAASFGVGENPSAARVLVTDRAGVERPGTNGAARLSHVLVSAESEANCSLLAGWVASCGLRAEALIPCGAASIAGVVERATAAARSGGALAATLWFGEHESYFVVTSADGVVLFRSLSVGVENFVEALLRPITPRQADGTLLDPVTIDRSDARTLLGRVGVPQPADVVDERRGFTGASVLPLMNPVLQRFCVEIKQSLRFGLSEVQRGGVTLSVVGPGAGLPRIDAALSSMCGVSCVSGGWAYGAGSGIAGVLEGLRLGDFGVQPASVAEERARRSARRAAWTGVGVAAAVIGLYGGGLYLETGAARRQAEALRAGAERAAQQDRANRAAAGSAAAALAAQRAIDSSLPVGPDHAAVLSLVGSAAERGTTLETVEVRETETGWVCRVSGVVTAVDDRDFAESVKAYSGVLSRSPLVGQVRLGATSRTRVGDRDGHRFDLTFELVGLPYSAVVPGSVAGVTPGGAGQ